MNTEETKKLFFLDFRPFCMVAMQKCGPFLNKFEFIKIQYFDIVCEKLFFVFAG